MEILVHMEIGLPPEHPEAAALRAAEAERAGRLRDEGAIAHLADPRAHRQRRDLGGAGRNGAARPRLLAAAVPVAGRHGHAAGAPLPGGVNFSATLLTCV
jgi:hypothetical protein